MRLIAVGLLLIGCSPVAKLELPNTPGAKSTLLLFNNEDGWTGEAVDRDQPALPYSIGGDLRVWALDYGVPLVEIGLRPGALVLAASGRPFPPSVAVTTRALPEGQWSPGDANDFALVRLRDIGPTCESSGFCFVKRNDEVYCDPLCVVPPLPDPPLPPVMPERPRMEPCPVGWVATTTTSELVVCVPPSLDCVGEERRFLGDLACAAEPRADWPTLPGPATYVDPAAAAGGDGSMARPLRTIAEAPAGSVIALHGGIYDEPGALDGLSLHGSSPESVLLRSAAPITIRGAVVLSGLAIEGGVRVETDLEIERVDLTAAAEVITLEPDAALRGQRVRVVGGTTQIVALGSGNIALEQSVLHDAMVTAIAGGSAMVRLLEVEIAPADEARGIVSGGLLDLHRSVIRGGAIGIELGAATASISQSLVVGAGQGLSALDSDVRLIRTEISQGMKGIVATAPVGSLDHHFVASHLVLRDFGGTGASFLGGDSEVDHLWVERAGELAINAVLARAHLSDVYTLQTHPSELVPTFGQATGFGSNGGELRLERWWVDDNAGFGMLIAQPGPGGAPYELEATDLSVYGVDKISIGDLFRGQGILLGRGGTAHLERVRTVETGLSGFRVEDGSNVVVRDLSIYRTEIGLEDREGAMLDVERVYIEEAQSTAIFCQGFGGRGSQARLSQLQIVDTSRAPDASDGIILKINDAPRATMTIDGFAISGMTRNGILVERDWDARISNGRVEGCGIGIHLDSIMSARANVESGVIYRDNRESFRYGE